MFATDISITGDELTLHGVASRLTQILPVLSAHLELCAEDRYRADAVPDPQRMGIEEHAAQSD
jgi:predicted anti-sigma-YlaC factor YlaD